MKKIILPSVILALLSIVPYFFRDPLTFDTPSYIYVSYYLTSFLVMFYFIRRYKFIYSNGIISFREAFKYGLWISIGYAIYAALISWAYATLNEDFLLQAMETKIKMVQEKAMETGEDLPASAEENMRSIFMIFTNPYVISGVTFIFSLLFGVIYSLISAAIVKSAVENNTDSEL